MSLKDLLVNSIYIQISIKTISRNHQISIMILGSRSIAS